MKEDVKKDVIIFLKYQLMFIVTFVYMELALRLFTVGAVSLDNFWFVLFLPAISMFFSALVGIVREKYSRLATSIVMGAITVFYFSQLIYYKIFDSYWAVSMMGMAGAATANFGKVIIPTFFGNLHWLIFLCMPLIALIVGSKKGKIELQKFKASIHILAVVLFVPVWLIGVFIIFQAGNEKKGAYYVYASDYVNTDSTIEKYGAFSTFLIEIGLSNLNFGSPKGDEIEPVPTDIIDYFATPIPTQQPLPTDSQSPITPLVTASPAPAEYWSLDIDFDALAEETDDEDIKQLCSYFGALTPSEKNNYSGLFEGYNLIYICAESFWTYAAHEAFTPTLYKLAHNGIVLNNFYNSFPNTTCNGEFGFATGLWPDVGRNGVHNGSDTGSFAQSYDKYMPYGLGNLFNGLGYNSYGFHNNNGSYYARNKSWPNLGYTCKFEEEDDIPGMVFTQKWVNSDLDMMKQSVDDFINDDKFHAYYMTFSGHGPYTADWDNENIDANLEEAKEINKDYGFELEALNYIAANMELDKALEYLLQRLEEAGKLENTVIVLTGDHYPYFLKSQDAVDQLAGHEMDMNIEKYKSTCIIYNAGMKENVYVDTYCSTLDILPTVLNLFNIEFDSRLLPGRDVFAENVIHKAMIGNYMGINKSFLTDYVQYDGDKDEATWLQEMSDFTEEQLNHYLESMQTLCMNEFKASLMTMETDFYRYVYRSLGLTD